MRISPKQLLQGLLYTAPVLLLALASCGGGGGGGGPTATLAASYTVGGAASGVLATSAASGLILRNNGSNDLSVASGVTSYQFSTAVVAGTPYKVTVLKDPSSPVQKCSVTNASGTMPGYNLTNANVSCVGAFTLSGSSITSLTGQGLVLQNNYSDNLLVPLGSSNFVFNTPLASGEPFTVRVLTQPSGQTCSVGNNTGTAPTGVTSLTISCTNNTGSVTPDQNVYVANSLSDNISAYPASGVLNTATNVPAGSSPSAIAVYANKFAYVTNRNANTISGFNIASGASATTALADIDGGTAGNQASIATGNTPFAIAIHPSGKFAYVVNEGSNSISAYSIDPTTGALSSIAADARTAGKQITTAYIPVAIAIDPAGIYAYVVSLGSSTLSNVCGHGNSPTLKGCISAYYIDQVSGALTAATVNAPSYNVDTGQTPSAIAVDNANVYVTNNHDGTIFVYPITSGMSGITLGAAIPATTGTGPSSIAINPVSNYLYVANAGSSNISIFSVSGLTISTYATANTGPAPASISVDSTGQYAYVANSGTGTNSNTISAFHITGGGATLAPVTGTLATSSYTAGTTPVSVTTSH
jgi:6-phosphogluconolactonase (cycloisomerase 2 family)